MKKSFLLGLVATGALCVPAVQADSNATGGGIVASESFSLGAGPFNHGAAVGSADNSIFTGATFTGGFTATHVGFSGTLTEVIGTTWGSEADIRAFDPFDFNSPVVWANPLGGTFTGPVAYDSFTEITPFNPAGTTWNVEFYDTFDDGAGADSFSENVVMTFAQIDPLADTNGAFSLGTLPVGETLSEGEFAVSGVLDTYSFTLQSDGLFSAGTEFKDVYTNQTVDTMLALFDAAGNPLAFDDDGGPGLYSLISGINLTAGDYTLLVSSYNGANDASTPLGSWTAGNGTGDYGLVLSFVPEPSSTLLIGGLGLAGLFNRRRRRD